MFSLRWKLCPKRACIFLDFARDIRSLVCNARARLTVDASQRQLYSPGSRHQSIAPALRPSDIKRRLTLGVERNGYVAMVSPGAGFVSGSHRARGCIGVSMTHWFDSLFYANLYSHFLTTNTGHGACRTTRSAVLPMKTCLRPVWP